MNKLLLAIVLAISPMIANAALISFTDRAAFEAALSSSTVENFSQSAQSFSSFDFGDFTATLQNASSGNLPALTGSELRLQLWNHASVLDFNFDSAQFGFGFDWRNTDSTGDDIEMLVDGTAITFGLDRSSGFFGVISDVALNGFGLSDTFGNGGALGYGYIDNLTYGSTSVSEPTPLALLSLGLVAIGFQRRLKKA